MLPAPPGRHTGESLAGAGFALSGASMKLRTLLPRFAAAVAVVLLLASTMISPASADTSTVAFVGSGPGWADIYNGTVSTRSYNFTVNGTATEAFCIEMNKAFNPTASYGVANPASVTVPGVGNAAWLAVNHATTGTAAADPADEASATQLAIWTFTDGITVDATTVPAAPIRVRALELAAAAATQTLPLVASDTTVAVTGVISGPNVVWTVTTSADGTPLAGQSVTLDVDGTPQSLTTGPSGSVDATTLAPAATVTSTATATWAVTTGPGAVLTPNTADQLLVTGTPSTATRSATSQVTTAAPVTTTTVAPPTTVTPTVPVTQPPATSAAAELPHTGDTFGLDQLLVGAFLLAASTVFFLRRRFATGS
jgi:TQXA domain-containing protein/LPXTG-motif cell wall-anchored protein